MIISLVPFYLGNRLVWTFDPSRNSTILHISYSGDRQLLEAILFLLSGVTLSCFSFVLVICCTIVLVVKLNSKKKWRRTTAVRGANSTTTGGVGTQDEKVVKMVTFIAAIYIVCFVPPTFLLFFTVINPDFRFDGKYGGIYRLLWSVQLSLEALNSSVNLFVYLRMSSKFQQVFASTFLNKEVK
ncbi:uncharacterized protein LOC101860253 [Aplysia californica]|uniref:Uncharacterized protein LOC101860253 n=1 Tax=Aplysia californica TaxID=6500 RepID=A0ABM0JRQ7_APLCA|nr:uncharacterized protein LOC101860253 [Aplysia californica]